MARKQTPDERWKEHAKRAADRLLEEGTGSGQGPVRAEWTAFIREVGRELVTDPSKRDEFVAKFLALGDTEEGRLDQENLGRKFGFRYDDFCQLVMLHRELKEEKRTKRTKKPRTRIGEKP